MATTLTSTVKMFIENLYSTPAVAAQFGTAHANINHIETLSFTDGVGANQVDRIYSETRTIAAAGTSIMDLTVLTNIFAASIAFVRVKAIMVFALAANTNNVVIGNTAADQFLGGFGAATHTWAVPPGGMFIATAPSAAGWALGVTTDLLFTNSGGGTGVTYDVIILGGSA